MSAPVAAYVPASPEEARDSARRVLLMVHELHRLGYQRLRIESGMSASGVYWRCTVVPAEGPNAGSARFSTGEGNACFGWKDAEADEPAGLARKLVERFPDLARRGAGEDAAYVAWYVDMLRRTAPLGVPISYADWDLPEDRISTLRCEGEVSLPLPPPAPAR